jgi:hypothetical protein
MRRSMNELEQVWLERIVWVLGTTAAPPAFSALCLSAAGLQWRLRASGSDDAGRQESPSADRACLR